MTVIQMERVSTAQLHEERAELLRSVGGSWAQLQGRMASGEFTPNERNIAERIEDIDFLLNGK